MSYGSFPYGGVAYADSEAGGNPETDTQTTLSVEVAFTTDALETPVWVDVTSDVRSWDTTRGRNRELERFQPGRATVLLGNLSRQYDSVYAAGPHFGDVRPMRRIRIRETFNGVTYPVFDGFIDRWQLDYPGTGKNATATVTATDAFKVFARTDLGPSVWDAEVRTDAPVIWWKLDETLDLFHQGSALNAGSGGTAMDTTFVGPPVVGGKPLVVNDPGSSLNVVSADATDVPVQGTALGNAAFSLLSQTVFSVECWIRWAPGGGLSSIAWGVGRSADANPHAIMGVAGLLGVGTVSFQMYNSTFTIVYGVEHPTTILPNEIHHVVATIESDGQLAIWLNGVRSTTLATGAAATSVSGVTRPTNGDLTLGHVRSSAVSATGNWMGDLDEVAVYLTPLDATRMAAHYAAGTTPWVNDFPSGRMRRVLSLSSWPGGPLYLPGEWVELDDGNVFFQSAELKTTALEHLQKCAETEFGLLFITRAGQVRFIDRAGQATRLPGPAVFGDDTAEVGYRNLVPDDGDQVVRNRTTISRLNGVAKNSIAPASADEFGRFQYTLDGLLHKTDPYSQDYADFIAAEYQTPRRRIISLVVGPPGAGEEAEMLPAMLGLELGDTITVRNQPVGGGAPFEQVCVVEGIANAGRPGGARTAVFTLSPEFTEALF